MEKAPTQVNETLKQCLKRSWRIATAESCSGGILATWLTELPGSSQVYLGGVSSYSNHLKTKLVQVPAEVIHEFGAVSQQTAELMATNIAQIAGAEIGLAITGIAGPSGGTPQKPVGSVWTAMSIHGQIHSQLLQLKGSRDSIRMESCRLMFIKLLEVLSE